MNTNGKTDSTTAPPASGNMQPHDATKADSTARDRDSRSLVRNLPLGAPRPANSKQ